MKSKSMLWWILTILLLLLLLNPDCFDSEEEEQTIRLSIFLEIHRNYKTLAMQERIIFV